MIRYYFFSGGLFPEEISSLLQKEPVPPLQPPPRLNLLTTNARIIRIAATVVKSIIFLAPYRCA
jgi:hypothetical protein